MFGQIPDFSNGFEFLRKLWATGSGMPGGLMPGLSAMTPPMDLADVDKRIHDLKAVESWLQLNTNLLRTTIQGLEVQRATLVALQTFGNALSPEAMQNAMENVARAANAPSAHPPEHHQPFSTGQTVSEAQADAENDEADDDDAPPDGTDAPADGGAEAAAEPGAAPLPPNASMWWNLLQQQFSQIASSAAAASAAAASAKPFGGMPGFGAAAAPGAEGVEPGVKGDPPPQRKSTANGNARPAAKKPAAKKAPAKKAAAKPAPRKTAATGTAKGAAGKAGAVRPEPGTPAAPGTPEDNFE